MSPVLNKYNPKPLNYSNDLIYDAGEASKKTTGGTVDINLF